MGRESWSAIMKYRNLGTSNLRASVIGLGTGQFGTRPWGYGTRYSKDQLIRVIHKAIQSGINVFDTAETYGNGLSEELLGEALSGYARNEFILVTKVAAWNLSYEKVVKAAERSLERLRLKTLDLYLIHYPNPLARLSETMRAMETLVKRGMVRYVGVSNFNVSLLRHAESCLRDNKIIVDEVEHNILSHRATDRVLPYCKTKGISVIAYSPLAGGILTGIFNQDFRPRDRARAFNFLARKRFLRTAEPLFNTLKDIAHEHDATVSQVSLSYIIQDKDIIAIPAAVTEGECWLKTPRPQTWN